MSFYGNISNVSKTQMQIDKTYRNRAEMEANAKDDNIAIGRYVLVEYGKIFPTHYHLGTYQGQPCLYFGPPSDKTRVEIKDKGSIQKGTKVHIVGSYEHNGRIIYHIWDNNNKPDNDDRAGLYEVTAAAGAALVKRCEDTVEDSYNENYANDRRVYGVSRGFDSTVWRKVVKDGEYAYEYVADLNTIVPTITSTAHAPSADHKENIPYFDEDSTNVLYNLHLYPTPGFRVKQAEEGNLTDNDNGLAIYFNEAGFLPETRTKIEDDDDISVEYTGKSGIIYPEGEAIDTYELSIYLPSLGNAISDIWDIVYPLKADSETERDTVIEGTNFYDENKYNVSTLAGCINTAQRILGIIQEIEGEPTPTEEDYLAGTLFKDTVSGKYYIIVKEIIPNPDLAAGWEETGNYIAKEVDITDPMNTIYQLMAQLEQEVHTVDSKIDAYYGKLDKAVEDLLTFKTIRFSTRIDENSGTSIDIVARSLADFVDIEVGEPLSFSTNTDNSVKLEIQVESEINETQNPISSKAVKTEVDTINEAIGTISDVLNYVLTGERPATE